MSVEKSSLPEGQKKQAYHETGALQPGNHALGTRIFFFGHRLSDSKMSDGRETLLLLLLGLRETAFDHARNIVNVNVAGPLVHPKSSWRDNGLVVLGALCEAEVFP